MAKTQQRENERLAFSVAEAAVALSCSKALIYQLIRQKKIRAVRLSTRRIVIPVKSLREQLEES